MEDIEPLYKIIGLRIRHYRRQQNLKTADLAAAIGLTRQSISNIEGGRQRIQIHTAFAAATALGVQLGDLLSENLAGAELVCAELVTELADENERLKRAMARIRHATITAVQEVLEDYDATD